MLGHSKSAPALLEKIAEEEAPKVYEQKIASVISILGFMKNANKYHIPKEPEPKDFNPCAVVPGCVPLNRNW